MLAQAHTRHLRHRVDARGHPFTLPSGIDAEQMTRCAPALLHRGGRERRRSDDVAGRVDVRVDVCPNAFTSMRPACLLSHRRGRRAGHRSSTRGRARTAPFRFDDCDHRPGACASRLMPSNSTASSSGIADVAAAVLRRTRRGSRRRAPRRRNPSGLGARSIIVTRTPSTAKIDAYSLAITPPPSTTSDSGRYANESIESLSYTFS